MRRGGSSANWFATLRRDRGLFALVGALAILLGLLQPVAEARNAEFRDLSVLCSDHRSGAPADPLRSNAPECPLCPTGHLCALHAALATPAQVQALQPSPYRLDQPPIPRASPRLPRLGSGAPPSIRAPPFPA